MLSDILSLLGVIFGCIGLIYSYLTAKELVHLKETHQLAFDHFDYHTTAIKHYHLANTRIIAQLSNWTTQPDLLSFLKKTKIETLVFYGIIKPGANLAKILKRYYLNKERKLNGLSKIQIYSKPDFIPKYLIADNTILLAKKIDKAGSAELCALFENNIIVCRLFVDYYEKLIQPSLIPFEERLHHIIDEFGIEKTDFDFLAEKLLEGENLPEDINYEQYKIYLKYAIKQ